VKADLSSMGWSRNLY